MTRRKRRDVKFILVGFGTKPFLEDYVTVDPSEWVVTAHDTTDDLIISIGTAKAWVDIEMDFDNARSLIDEIEETMARKLSRSGPDYPHLRSSVE